LVVFLSVKDRNLTLRYHGTQEAEKVYFRELDGGVLVKVSFLFLVSKLVENLGGISKPAEN